MTTVGIPTWNSAGVLPPIDPVEPASANRSPYRVALADAVLRFGTSKERCGILDGLLRYRAALHVAGLVTGFQWVDGSFLEHVESLENRPPNDVDVVTFYHLPAGVTQAAFAIGNTDLLNSAKTKAAYQVDGYVTSLGNPADRLVRRASYWYGLWSHRRDRTWKGFIEIDLAPDDVTAREHLRKLSPTGGTP